MKRFLWLSLLLLPATSLAADSYFIRWKTDTQDSRNIKLIDNGDGTYSEKVIVNSVLVSSSNYSLQTASFTVAIDTLTYDGTGLSWSVEVHGGDAFLLLRLR